jgi:ribonuclease BN (tRNA processing enzyme)
MKVQLLPSTIDENGRASARQHLLTVVVDDQVAIDAGCLAFSCTDLQRKQVRDIVLTHAHLDHVAGLPLFVDDLFSTVTEPIRIHSTPEMRQTLERDIFNWSIYPRFSELSNANGAVMEYREFEPGSTFKVKHLSIRAVAVNHKVPANGYIVSGTSKAFAITGDTAETDEFWRACNETKGLDAAFVECAFPDELAELASASFHLTPAKLRGELEKLTDRSYPVYIINIKPMYRAEVVQQIEALGLSDVRILDVGKVYEI